MSCGQRTVSFLRYSETVVRLPCRDTSRSNSRCRHRPTFAFSRAANCDVKFRITIFGSSVVSCGLLRSLLWSSAVSCGLLAYPLKLAVRERRFDLQQWGSFCPRAVLTGHRRDLSVCLTMGRRTNSDELIGEGSSDAGHRTARHDPTRPSIKRRRNARIETIIRHA